MGTIVLFAIALITLRLMFWVWKERINWIRFLRNRQADCSWFCSRTCHGTREIVLDLRNYCIPHHGFDLARSQEDDELEEGNFSSSIHYRENQCRNYMDDEEPTNRRIRSQNRSIPSLSNFLRAGVRTLQGQSALAQNEECDEVSIEFSQRHDVQ
jgi:hypothetical protein